MEKYEEIKKLLSDNKITSDDLDKYLEVKALRHARYQELNMMTDNDIEAIVNGMDIPNIEEGE